jgi:2'-5' RNA ligase
MQRTFIALKIKPQKEMADCFRHFRESLKGERIKWVDPAKLHITLRFLGDTDPGQVRATGKILEETVPRFNCPEIVFRGTGVFRNVHDPRVLWIGMEVGPVLPELKLAVDRQLAGIGFPAEDRRFRPHLTLGRIKFIRDRDTLAQLLGEYRDVVFQKDRIDEIIYYESILRHEGPEYLPLKTVPFSQV